MDIKAEDVRSSLADAPSGEQVMAYLFTEIGVQGVWLQGAVRKFHDPENSSGSRVTKKLLLRQRYQLEGMWDLVRQVAEAGEFAIPDVIKERIPNAISSAKDAVG